MKKKIKLKAIAVASSDWHYHIYDEFNEEGRRTIAKRGLIKEIYGVAKTLGVPHFFCGDMVHNKKHLQNELLNVISLDLPQLSKSVVTYGISGNHDQCFANNPENKSPNYVKSFSRLIPNFNCIDFKTIEDENFTLHGLPYITHNRDYQKLLGSFKTSKTKPNILLIHTDLPGAKDTSGREVGTVSGIPDSMDLFFDQFDLILSGHIHKKQRLTKKVIMLGAPDQQRRSDMGAVMGYWIIYNDLSVEFKRLSGPEYKYSDDPENDPDKYNFLIQKPTENKVKVVGEKIKKKNVLSSYIMSNGFDKNQSKILRQYLKGYL